MANDTTYIFEVLKEIDSEPSGKKKVEILKKNDTNALRHILRGALDPNIKWLLPPGTPVNFKPDFAPEGLQNTSIHKVTPTFYLYCQAGVDSGRAKDLSTFDRERLFVQMLESLHAKDAEVIIQMKDQNIKCKGLTPKLVNKAFPGLISEAKWD